MLTTNAITLQTQNLDTTASVFSTAVQMLQSISKSFQLTS